MQLIHSKCTMSLRNRQQKSHRVKGQKVDLQGSELASTNSSEYSLQPISKCSLQGEQVRIRKCPFGLCRHLKPGSKDRSRWPFAHFPKSLVIKLRSIKGTWQHLRTINYVCPFSMEGAKRFYVWSHSPPSPFSSSCSLLCNQGSSLLSPSE